MSEQVHNRLADEQVKMILGRYTAKELMAAEAIELLGLKRRQFFEWAQRYRKDPNSFSVQYSRKEKNRKLDATVGRHILAIIGLMGLSAFVPLLVDVTGYGTISVFAHLHLTLEADEPHVPVTSIRQGALSNLG